MVDGKPYIIQVSHCSTISNQAALNIEWLLHPGLHQCCDNLKERDDAFVSRLQEKLKKVDYLQVMESHQKLPQTLLIEKMAQQIRKHRGPPRATGHLKMHQMLGNLHLCQNQSFHQLRRMQMQAEIPTAVVWICQGFISSTTSGKYCWPATMHLTEAVLGRQSSSCCRASALMTSTTLSCVGIHSYWSEENLHVYLMKS